MEQTKLSGDQKEVIAGLMCDQAIAWSKIQDIADSIELDSDLQVEVQCAALALHTGKVRLGQLLVQ